MNNNLSTFRTRAVIIALEGKSLVSTESLSVHRPLAGTVAKLSGFLKELGDDLGYRVSGIQDTLFKTDVKTKKGQELLLSRLPGTDYLNLAPIRVPVVPGLRVTWLDLLHNMKPGVEFSVSLQENVIHPFKQFVATALTNPEKFSSSALNSTVNFVDYELLKKSLGASVSGNASVNVRKYGECVARNSDMAEVLDLTNNFEHVFMNSNPQMLMAEIDELRELFGQLSANITDTNQQFRLNGKTISNLATAAYNVAESVEYYAAVRTLFINHANAMKAAVDKLVKAV
ncbi:hypothetical protein [Erwinia phage vB_Ea277G]|nr:hypothetical protein [Erwinia phage vB_Ea277G]